MPTRRPTRPHHPTPRPDRILCRCAVTAPLLAVSGLAALAAATMLTNLNWTSTYRPDPFGHQSVRHRDRPNTTSPDAAPESDDPHDEHPEHDRAATADSARSEPPSTPPARAATPPVSTDGPVDRDAESTADSVQRGTE